MENKESKNPTELSESDREAGAIRILPKGEILCSDGSIAYRERDSALWGLPEGELRTALSNAQVLTIISATGLPLRGWDRLPKEGDLELGDPIKPALGQDRRMTGTEVRHAVDTLNVAFGPLRGTLIGSANTGIQKSLRKSAKQLERLLRDIQTSGSLYTATAGSSAYRLWEPFAGEGRKWVDRLRYSADQARKESKVQAALVSLIPPLEECYRQLFGKEPTGRWNLKDETMEASSPFVFFAEAYLKEQGVQAKPNTIQKNLYTSHKQRRWGEKSSA